jgi:hypothetical protein
MTSARLACHPRLTGVTNMSVNARLELTSKEFTCNLFLMNGTPTAPPTFPPRSLRLVVQLTSLDYSLNSLAKKERML